MSIPVATVSAVMNRLFGFMMDSIEGGDFLFSSDKRVVLVENDFEVWMEFG
jgi:hypothetical protein